MVHYSRSFFSVQRLVRSYTLSHTIVYDRNTGTCNTAKYGCIRSVCGMYTVVYGIVYDRLRRYTTSVKVDLGLVLLVPLVHQLFQVLTE